MLVGSNEVGETDYDLQGDMLFEYYNPDRRNLGNTVLVGVINKYRRIFVWYNIETSIYHVCVREYGMSTFIDNSKDFHEALSLVLMECVMRGDSHYYRADEDFE